MKIQKVDPESSECKVKPRYTLVEYKECIKNQCQRANWAVFLWRYKLPTTGVCGHQQNDPFLGVPWKGVLNGIAHRDTGQAVALWIYAGQAVRYTGEAVTWGCQTPQTTAGKGGLPLFMDPWLNSQMLTTLIGQCLKLFS